MTTQELQDDYELYIRDSEFQKNFQQLLTPEFLDWWFSQIPLPHESGWNQREYFERMSWMLIGWLGNQKMLKKEHESSRDMEESEG